MGRRRNQSKNTMFLLLVLILLGIGIAYAILTENLTINNTVSYDAMKWDVGFTSAEDGWDSVIDMFVNEIEEANGASLEELDMTREDVENLYENDMKDDGVIYSNSTASISSDKKSITVNVDLGMTSSQQLTFVRATITNNSTFNVAISETPVVTYDDTYIAFSDIAWWNHDLYDFDSYVFKGQTIGVNESAEVLIIISTQELTEDMLPATELSIPVTIEMNFEEVDYSVRDLAMLVPYKYDTKFWTDNYRSKIKNITFEDKINVPDYVIESWDMSLQKDGRVMSYIVPNASDSTYYDLYIQSDEQLYANFDMSEWFQSFVNVDSVNGLELLDTRYTVDMSSMFENTGFNSLVFNMDTSGFDMSNVTDVAGMFCNAGYNSTRFVTSITIRNPNTIYYGSVFWNVATQSGSQITVNYTYETSDLVDEMIATKETNANVVKGEQVY